MVFQVLDWLTLEPVPQAHADLKTPAGYRSLEVDDGVLALESGVAPGDLLVEADGYFPLLVEPALLRPPGGVLHLVPSEPIQVRCLSADSREPIGGAEVALGSGLAGQLVAATSEDGIADFDASSGVVLGGNPAQDPGQDRSLHRIGVQARAAGHLEARAQLDVRPGEPWGRIEVALEPARRVLVRAVDAASGDPVPGVSLLHQWNHQSRLNANRRPTIHRTDEAGEALLDVRAGASGLQVISDHPDYATAGARVADLSSLPGGMRAFGGTEESCSELILSLERAYEAEGIVIDEDGRPVVHATVDLDPVDGDDFSDWMRFMGYRHLGHVPDMGPTDEEGRFLFTRLRAGEYRVGLHHRLHADDQENPTLRVGEDGAAWLGVLGRGLSATGMTVDPEGRPLAGARVIFFRLAGDGSIASYQEKQVRPVQSSDDGTFEVAGLRTGSYKVQALKGGRYRSSLQVIEAGAHPPGWRIVLEPSSPRADAGTGALWLRLLSEAGYLVEGNALVRLHRPEDLSPAGTYQDSLVGGQLYWSGAPRGVFHVVVEVEGLAPAVLQNVEVLDDPQEAVEVDATPGINVSIEVPPLERSSGLVVSRRFDGLTVVRSTVRASADSQRVDLRLLPGEYAVKLRSRGRPDIEGSLGVEWRSAGSAQPPGFAPPDLRLEMPSEPTVGHSPEPADVSGGPLAPLAPPEAPSGTQPLDHGPSSHGEHP